MPSHLSFTSPLPPEDLFIESMTDRCGLSQLGEMQLNLLSERPDILAKDLLGKTVSVVLQREDGVIRHYHGHVVRFGIGAHRGRYFGYAATVRPWLWFLSRTSDCRIFQELSVPDIVKKVFDDHRGVAQFEFKLFRQYRPWVYCVQYRETDFNFIARLLEHEGIYWYFQHEEGQHKLVLVDSMPAHDPAPHCEPLPYYGPGGTRYPDIESVHSWDSACAITAGKTAARSYDFERPGVNLLVSTTEGQKLDLDKYEMYDYQGDYVQARNGLQCNEDRLTELQSAFQSMRGSSNAQGLQVGYLFEMDRHPRDDENRKYLITGLQTSALSSAHSTDAGVGDFMCSFEAIPDGVQFRPPRITPKPFVQGPQTAVVVGPEGDEIYTDKYGRVKVQFHWDRYGEKNEKSSCWVRVSHPWAGKNYGAIHIPRIGQEVVVDFLEGDPDQPIITGRVYNAEQMPPWELPKNATQSGILTRSSKDGEYGNANSINFEDKKGAELFSLHAERNMSKSVEVDDDISVGQDQSIGIKRDQKLSVMRDRSVYVKENETRIVDLSQKLKVGTTQDVHIVADQTTQIDGKRSLTVKGNIQTETKSDHIQTVKGNESRSVTGNETVLIGGNQTFGVTGNVVYKAAKMTFEAGHVDFNITGANSVVHTSPNGPYSIMANKFVVLSNTDASILAVGKINQTSMENNVTVMGNNNSGYMGMASETNMGLARSTFLGLQMDSFMGASISNTMALQFEAVLAAKLSIAVGPHIEMNTMKVYTPGGGGGAGGANVLTANQTMLASLGVSVGGHAGFISALAGFSELSDQYKDARAELYAQADAAAAEGHPGLASRLRRLASGQSVGDREPTSTQDAGDGAGRGGEFAGSGASGGAGGGGGGRGGPG